MKRSFVSHLVLGFGLGLVALGAGCATNEPDARRAPGAQSQRAPASGALQAAHEAYLDADWPTMGERVRDVLLDPAAGELTRANAFELLDKAYEVTSGRLPSRFELPPDIQLISYGQMHDIDAGAPRNAIFFQARLRDASHVTGVAVRRLPGETLIDTRAGKGTYEVIRAEPGFEDIKVEIVVAELPADGVFTLRIERDDAPPTEGWFIARSMTSSAVPEVRSPVSSRSFTERNPVMSWVPFRSPELAPYEQRSLYVSVSGDAATNGKALSWSFWTADVGELAQLRIGDHPGTQKLALEPGTYWALLGAIEARQFGPVRLERVSRRGNPFHVLRSDEPR